MFPVRYQLPSSEMVAFSCTACGACCHHQAVGLTVDEALAWTEEGGELAIAVQFDVAEALDSGHAEIPQDYCQWIKDRSFEGRSGRVRLYMTATLYAKISSTCHHLVGKLCGIYDRRPLTCQAYPAQTVNPPDEQEPIDAQSACPPEAWTGRPYQEGARLSDNQARAAVQAFHAAAIRDRPVLAEVATRIADGVATMREEPLIASVDTPTSHIVAAIHRARSLDGRIPALRQWQIVTLDPARVAMCQELGLRLHSRAARMRRSTARATAPAAPSR